MMTNTFKHRSVLLVDDVDLDNFVSKTIINAFKFAEEVYTLAGADSAINFLKSIASNKDLIFPEVIFIDINMPAIDGFEFIERLKIELKSELELHKPKLVVLTSSVFNSDRQKAKETYNEIIFMVKPLSGEMLKTI